MSSPTIRKENSDTNTSFLTGFAAKQTVLLKSRSNLASLATRLDPELAIRFDRYNDAARTIITNNNSKEPSEETNNIFERYNIVRKIYSGAEAQVYLAQRKDNRATIILKVYHKGIAPDSGVMDRLRNCASDHVVRLNDYGWLTDGGQYYEELEHIELGDLRGILGFPLSEYDCRLILNEMAAALNHLHSDHDDGLSLIHRDVKPANILIRSNSPELDLVLCDFGIATLIPEGTIKITERRDRTPKYAPPETLLGQVSAASDYWSLGIVLFEALQGRHPLDGKTDAQIELELRSGWHPDVSILKSVKWQELLAGMTNPDPKERWGYGEIDRWLNPAAIRETTSEAATEEEFFESFDYLKADSVHNLVIQLVKNWNRVSPLLDDRLFRRFLGATFDRLLPGRSLADFLEQEGHPDIRLLKLIYRLCPDFPHFWKGIRVFRQDLLRNCQKAITGNFLWAAFIEEFYDLQVLQTLGIETRDEDPCRRADEWQKSFTGYNRLQKLMVDCGAPEEPFPGRAHVLATLYLWACEDGAGLSFVEEKLTIDLLFAYPWLRFLQAENTILSSEQRMLRSILLPICIEKSKDNFLVSHKADTAVSRLEAQQIHDWGWRTPTATMNATHIDYELNICGNRKTIAKGVMLSWNVHGAFLVYLTRFGFVASNGQRPNERMSHWNTYRVVDRCSCVNHDAFFFTLWETTSFTLTAVGPLGISVYQLPTIVVPPPVLEPQAQFTVAMPQLMPQAEYTVTIPELLPVAEFTVPMPQLLPQPAFTVKTLTSSDLMEQAQFTVRPLSGKDLHPVPRFIE